MSLQQDEFINELAKALLPKLVYIEKSNENASATF